MPAVERGSKEPEAKSAFDVDPRPQTKEVASRMSMLTAKSQMKEVARRMVMLTSRSQSKEAGKG